MKKMIWFDMDGTIADLYSVDNWLPKLREQDASPYAEAEVMLNMSLLARLLNKVQAIGYGIGIISWLSKCPTPEYDEAVTEAKLAWLKLRKMLSGCSMIASRMPSVWEQRYIPSLAANHTPLMTLSYWNTVLNRTVFHFHLLIIAGKRKTS